MERHAPLTPRPGYYRYPAAIIRRSAIGAIRLRDVTAEHIEAFRSARLGEGASRPTINRNVAVLSKILRVARDWRYIESIPRVKAFKENRGRTRFLSGDEAQRLIAAIRSDLRPLIQFLIATGCRRGEALGLSWADVDLPGRRVTFRHTKSGHDRTIPLSSGVAQTLATMKRDPGSRVFPFTPSMLRRPFKRALRVAGIDGAVLHTLRHSAASLMAQSNISLQRIADVLGHRSLSTTRRYSHLTTEDLRGAVDAVEQAINGDKA